MHNATQALCARRTLRLVGAPTHLLVGVRRLRKTEQVVGSRSKLAGARVAGIKESRHLAAKLNAHRVGAAHGKVPLVAPCPKHTVWMATAQVVLHWHVWRRWRRRGGRWRVFGRGRRGHGLHAFTHGLVVFALWTRAPSAERPTAGPGVCRRLEPERVPSVHGVARPWHRIPRHPLRPGRGRPVVARKRIRGQVKGNGLKPIDATNGPVVPPEPPIPSLVARVPCGCTSVWLHVARRPNVLRIVVDGHLHERVILDLAVNRREPIARARRAVAREVGAVVFAKIAPLLPAAFGSFGQNRIPNLWRQRRRRRRRRCGRGRRRRRRRGWRWPAPFRLANRTQRGLPKGHVRKRCCVVVHQNGFLCAARRNDIEAPLGQVGKRSVA